MIYHVYANRYNIGDWLSARGVQELLSPLNVRELLCNGPYVEETMAVLEQATSKDLIVIGGGGLLMKYFEPFWRKFVPVAARVPFCLWGVGICDLKEEESLPDRDLMREIVRQSRLCVVRDDLTHQYLNIAGLPAPVPCPSMCVIQRPARAGQDILHVVNYNTVGGAAYEFMCRTGQEFAAEAGRVYAQTNNEISQDHPEHMFKLLDKYARAAFVLSSGLHGCIIGVSMGAKVLAVSGDRKIEGFMNAVGLRDWVLAPTQTALIPRRLRELHSQPVPEAIEDIKARNRDVAARIKAIALG